MTFFELQVPVLEIPDLLTKWSLRSFGWRSRDQLAQNFASRMYVLGSSRFSQVCWAGAVPEHCTGLVMVIMTTSVLQKTWVHITIVKGRIMQCICTVWELALFGSIYIYIIYAQTYRRLRFHGYVYIQPIHLRYPICFTSEAVTIIGPGAGIHSNQEARPWDHMDIWLLVLYSFHVWSKNNKYVKLQPEKVINFGFSSKPSKITSTCSYIMAGCF